MAGGALVAVSPLEDDVPDSVVSAESASLCVSDDDLGAIVGAWNERAAAIVAHACPTAEQP